MGQRVVLGPAFPEGKERDRELAGDGDHGALLRGLAAAGGDAFAGGAQV